MGISEDYNQAAALINRLLEVHGGSINAYEEPLQEPEPDPPSPLDRIFGPLPEGALPKVADNEESDCLDGLWDRISNAPPPVSDEYEFWGVDHDSPELTVIYAGFETARQTGQPQIVALETGQYILDRNPTTGGWQLEDTVKGRFYSTEVLPGARFGPKAKEGDLFIWVMPTSNKDVSLGYIHQGYVFLLKEEEE
jgi:hypothetical protein